jgi:DNA-directed RNA polymerase specialized sigma subunit
VLHNDSSRWDRARQRRNLEGDRAAREALIERYVPLADSLARRFGGGREPMADLQQVAYLGLIAAADTAIDLEQACSVLDRRAREVVRLRYRDDLLQREIAERVGCSQMQVSRILVGALATLRAAMGHP